MTAGAQSEIVEMRRTGTNHVREAARVEVPAKVNRRLRKQIAEPKQTFHVGANPTRNRLDPHAAVCQHHASTGRDIDEHVRNRQAERKEARGTVLKQSTYGHSDANRTLAQPILKIATDPAIRANVVCELTARHADEPPDAEVEARVLEIRSLRRGLSRRRHGGAHRHYPHGQKTDRERS